MRLVSAALGCCSTAWNPEQSEVIFLNACLREIIPLPSTWLCQRSQAKESVEMRTLWAQGNNSLACLLSASYTRQAASLHIHNSPAGPTV